MSLSFVNCYDGVSADAQGPAGKKDDDCCEPTQEPRLKAKATYE